MRVFATAFLSDAIRTAGQDPAVLIEAFRGWKAGGKPVRRFGKDAPYLIPLVDGANHLCHVHLRPATANARWDAAHDARDWARKTSDTALVYVRNDGGDYLLIATMLEGDAHRVARMATPEDVQLMTAFAAIASEWRRTGAIVA